jgi:DNA-binding Lrp family transcriptional regulator
MQLKPQDILVLLKLIAIGREDWAYNTLAIQLSMSASEVHAAIKRALESGLALQRGKKITPNVRNLEEFLCHGIRYAFVAERGGMTRGTPTAHAAPPLDKVFVPDGEPIPVWPDAEGSSRGLSFSPLYKSVPAAAKSDLALYELLVLVDAVRGGRARERNYAINELKKRLSAYAHAES